MLHIVVLAVMEHVYSLLPSIVTCFHFQAFLHFLILPFYGSFTFDTHYTQIEMPAGLMAVLLLYIL